LCAGLLHSDGSAEAVSPLLSALAVRLQRMTNSPCSRVCVSRVYRNSCNCNVRCLLFDELMHFMWHLSLDCDEPVECRWL
jgi:hypothetical protein